MRAVAKCSLALVGMLYEKKGFLGVGKKIGIHFDIIPTVTRSTRSPVVFGFDVTRVDLQ